MPSQKTLAHFSPGRIILYSVFFTILLGTLALALPIARTQPVAFIDLIFTATSSACVTGLFTVPLDHFSHFGHTIIMILMQIGGIGLITLTIFLLSLFVDLGFAHQVMAGQLMELESWKNVKKIIIFITATTFSIELIGAAAIFPILYGSYPLQEALYLSLFHSISSFCNAGITLFGQSLTSFTSNYFMLSITSILMIIGGLGFITWREIVYYCMSLRKKKRYSFSLHSKIILYGTLSIIVVGSIIIFLLEYHHTLAQLSLSERVANALFQATSFRSGGFTTIAFASISLPAIFACLPLMFIGAAPGSTGSGVKIPTITLCIATIRATILDRETIELKGRSIANDQIYRAIAIIVLAICWISITTLLLLITESSTAFFPILLESVSAFGNIGVSLGITKTLSIAGKAIVIISMVIGRIGALTLVMALRQITLRRAPEPKGFTYPEERIMLS